MTISDTPMEFQYLDHDVRIVERENALVAKFTAHIDGVSTGVAFHLASSAAEDARREVERMVAERRRVDPQFKMPPNREAFASAEAEDQERFDLCS